jgi:hypothetical protein
VSLLVEAVVPRAGSATTRTVFEGFKTTTRTVAMVKEARYLFQLRGYAYPKISQGGYNAGGVSASSGTHDEDAMDDAIKTFGTTKAKVWEWCNWEVGFAGWIRAYLAGVWPMHFHKLPKGGQLSPAADAQIVQWHQGDNALRTDLAYPRIESSGFINRTWGGYRKIRPSGNVDLSGTVGAFKTGKPPSNTQNEGDNDIQQIQRALNHFLDSKLVVDGIPGSVTKGVYATYQSRLYGVAKGTADANGIPGPDSLSRLGFNVYS